MQPDADNQDGDDEQPDSDDDAVDRLLENACDVKRALRNEYRQRIKQVAMDAPHAIDGASKAALASLTLKGKKVIFKWRQWRIKIQRYKQLKALIKKAILIQE